MPCTIIKNSPLIKHERHPFHLVSPSPWPLMVSFISFNCFIFLWLYASVLCRESRGMVLFYMLFTSLKTIKIWVFIFFSFDAAVENTKILN